MRSPGIPPLRLLGAVERASSHRRRIRDAVPVDAAASSEYVVTWSGRTVRLLDRAEGTEQWAFKTPKKATFDGTAVIGDGIVILTAQPPSD